MRLLSVIPALGAGGAEVVAGAVATDAARRGHESVVASAGGFRLDELRAGGVRHHTVPLASRRPQDLGRAALRLRQAVPGRPDVVHAHNVKAALVARAAFGPGTPVLTTLHGVPAAEVGRGTRVLRATSDLVVAVSPYVATQLSVYGLASRRIRVVENGFSAPAIPSDPAGREEVRSQLGIAPGGAVVLCAARFAGQKRHDLLVEAWRRVADRAVLVLAGDGPTRPKVEAAVRDAGLEGSVRFLGERSDVPRLLAASDLLVLPTDWEGLPISLLEAMSAGVPVVVSRVGGVVETLGAAVRLAPPGSAEGLGDALVDLVDGPTARADLSRRGRELVTRRFAVEPMLAAYRELYEDAARWTR